MTRDVSEIMMELRARRSELLVAQAVLDKLQRNGNAAEYEIDQRQQHIRGILKSIHQLEEELVTTGHSGYEQLEQEPERPSAIATACTLPFDKLSPDGFERLCLWLVGREGYKRAEHLGASGREQGRDIIAWRGDQLWAFQCKRVKRFGPKGALTEVKKVLTLPKDQRPTGLVFIVTCYVSAQTRQQARDRCAEEDMDCHFWASTELDEKVKRHTDILEEFFQVIRVSSSERT